GASRSPDREGGTRSAGSGALLRGVLDAINRRLQCSAAQSPADRADSPAQDDSGASAPHASLTVGAATRASVLAHRGRTPTQTPENTADSAWHAVCVVPPRWPAAGPEVTHAASAARARRTPPAHPVEGGRRRDHPPARGRRAAAEGA